MRRRSLWPFGPLDATETFGSTTKVSSLVRLQISDFRFFRCRRSLMLVVFLVIGDFGVVLIAAVLPTAPPAGVGGLCSRALGVDREQRDQPLEFVALARGALRRIRVQDQLLEPVAAGSTFVFVDWHSRTPRCSRVHDARARLLSSMPPATMPITFLQQERETCRLMS